MTSSLILKQFNFQYQCIWFKKISFHYYSWNYDMLKDLQKLAFSPLPLLFTIHVIPQNSGKGSVISLWWSVSCSRAVLFVVIALTHTQAASHLLQVESLQILDLDWFSKKKKVNYLLLCWIENFISKYRGCTGIHQSHFLCYNMHYFVLCVFVIHFWLLF